MAAGPTVTLTFAGDESQLSGSFQQLAKDSDSLGEHAHGASKGLEEAEDSTEKWREKADEADTKAMGFADTMTGVQDSASGVSMIMQGDLFNGTLTLTQGISDLGSGFYNTLIPAFSKFGGFLKATVIPSILETSAALLASPITWIVIGIGLIIAAVVLMVTHWQTVKDIAGKVFDFLRAAFQPVADFFVAAWGQVEQVALVVWDAIRTAASTVFSWLQTAWSATAGAMETAWDAVTHALSVAWDAVASAFSTGWAAVRTAAETVIGWLQTAWDAVTHALSVAWDAVVTAYQAQWTVMKTAASTVIGWLQDAWKAVSGLITSLWDGDVQAFKNAWANMKAQASAVIDWLKSAWSGVTGAVSGVATGIQNAFRSAFNFVASAWNNTVGSLNFSIPSWVPGIGGSSFGVPQIPLFDNGGVVGGAPGSHTLAMLQAGETVLATQGGGGVAIQVVGSSGGALDRMFLDWLQDMSARGRLRLVTG